jgi:hypothetical protein
MAPEHAPDLCTRAYKFDGPKRKPAGFTCCRQLTVTGRISASLHRCSSRGSSKPKRKRVYQKAVEIAQAQRVSVDEVFGSAFAEQVSRIAPHPVPQTRTLAKHKRRQAGNAEQIVEKIINRLLGYAAEHVRALQSVLVFKGATRNVQPPVGLVKERTSS